MKLKRETFKLPVNYSEILKKDRRKVRELYIEIQNERCYLCECNLYGSPSEKYAKYKVTPYLYPKGFFENPIHLHHSHVTDLTLGAVHAHCNAVLWEYFNE